MQRTARFLLWGGLAVILIGMTGCGVGCIAGVDAVLGNSESEDFAGGAIAYSVLGLGLGLVMVIIGAILKAVSPESKEPE